MAKQTAAKGESAKQVAIDVLRAADGPLKAKEVAKRVIDSGRCAGLKGKTPEATISAILAVGSKPGGPFKRADKGTYTLADRATRPTNSGKHDSEAKPRTEKRTAKPRTGSGRPRSGASDRDRNPRRGSGARAARGSAALAAHAP